MRYKKGSECGCCRGVPDTVRVCFMYRGLEKRKTVLGSKHWKSENLKMMVRMMMMMIARVICLSAQPTVHRSIEY